MDDKKFECSLSKKDMEDIFANFKNKKIGIDNSNNIFLKCKISENEALNGCMKKIKFRQICENGKVKENILDVKIPKGIKNDQSIIYYEQGNYIKELETRSNIVIKINIK